MSDINKIPLELRPWIGVDFDGTLFMHPKDGSIEAGAPIPLMIKRLKAWLNAGKRVKIMTARWADKLNLKEHERVIREALLDQLGEKSRDLEITNEKDFLMIELWDDRAVSVVRDVGTIRGEPYV